jgi:hypothetical protein
MRYVQGTTGRRSFPQLLLLVALLVLGTRTGGAHWHVCLDGLERPQSVHWAEPGLTDEHAHANASLEDRDLCITADAVASPTPPELLPHPAAVLCLRQTLAGLLPQNLPVARIEPPAHRRLFLT